MAGSEFKVKSGVFLKDAPGNSKKHQKIGIDYEFLNE